MIDLFEATQGLSLTLSIRKHFEILIFLCSKLRLKQLLSIHLILNNLVRQQTWNKLKSKIIIMTKISIKVNWVNCMHFCFTNIQITQFKVSFNLLRHLNPQVLISLCRWSWYLKWIWFFFYLIMADRIFLFSKLHDIHKN